MRPEKKRFKNFWRRSGRALTWQLLESHEVNEGQLERKGRSWYRKAPSQGHYQTLYGPVTVRPHTYQRSDGGQTFCPLEEACQMGFGTSTPLLAKVLAVKLSALTPREVRPDLETAHRLSLSASFIEQTARRVGEIVVTKARCWRLESPEPGRRVATIATVVDGRTMPLGGCDHKEAMCRTIALSDNAGERLSTEYLGAMPEAGKESFRRLLTSRVAAIKAEHPRALHVCLADGAAWNWQLLESPYPGAIWILDFYHAAQHLGQAAEAIFGTPPTAAKSAWYEDLYLTLRDQPDGVAQLIRRLIYTRNRERLSKAAARALETEINSFRNHAEKMQYADHVTAGLPIGSSVTEAGCKELIKARFSRSGMRWKRDTGATILHLRAVRLSDQSESFWQKVIRYVA